MAPPSEYQWPLVTVIGIVILAGLTVFMIGPASQVFLVTFSAVLFAVSIDGLAVLITNRVSISQVMARIGVIVILLALLLGFVTFAGPRLSEQISELADQLPRAVESLNRIIASHPLGKTVQDINLQQLPLNESQILSGVTGVFSTAFGATINTLIIVLIGLYLSLQPQIYVEGFLHLVPKDVRGRTRNILDDIHRALSWWLVGRFFSMLTVGVLTTITLWLIDMPLALVLGVIAGIFSFVPFVGPITASIPAILIGLMDSPLTGVYVTLIYMAVQFIEGNFLTPLIQERVVSLPPALLLLAQFAMGIFYGLFGILLATPLAILLIVLTQKLYVQDIVKEPVEVLGDHHHTARHQNKPVLKGSSS